MAFSFSFFFPRFFLFLTCQPFSQVPSLSFSPALLSCLLLLALPVADDAEQQWQLWAPPFILAQRCLGLLSSKNAPGWTGSCFLTIGKNVCVQIDYLSYWKQKGIKGKELSLNWLYLEAQLFLLESWYFDRIIEYLLWQCYSLCYMWNPVSSS